jgi:hypothetical protein
VLIICLDDLIRTQVVLLISLGPRIEEVLHTWIIFLSCIPAMKTFCLSPSGW